MNKNFNVPQYLLQRESGVIRGRHFQTSCMDSSFTMERMQIDKYIMQGDHQISRIAFDSSGSVLLGVTSDLDLNLWNWDKNELICSHNSSQGIFDVKFLNLLGGYHLVTCGARGELRYIHIGDAKVHEDVLLYKYSDCCYGVCINVEQPQILLSIGDGSVRRHDLRIQTDVHKLLGTKGYLFHIDSNPANFNEFVTCGNDIRIYDQRHTKRPMRIFSQFINKFTFPVSAYFNENGLELLTTCRNGIYLFDVNSEDYPQIKLNGTNNLRARNHAKYFGPHNNYIVSGSECGHLFIWDKSTKKLVQCSPGDEKGPIVNVQCHPKEPYLCSTGFGTNIQIWFPSYMRNISAARVMEYNILDTENFESFDHPSFNYLRRTV